MLVDLDFVLAKVSVYLQSALVEYNRTMSLNMGEVTNFYSSYIREYRRKEKILRDAISIFNNGGNVPNKIESDSATIKLIQNLHTLQNTIPFVFLSSYNAVPSSCMLTVLKRFALEMDVPTDRTCYDCQMFNARELKVALQTSTNATTSGDIAHVKNLPVRFWGVVTNELYGNVLQGSLENYLIRCIETVSSSCSVDFYEEMDKIMKAPPQYMLPILESYLHRGLVQFYSDSNPLEYIGRNNLKRSLDWDASFDLIYSERESSGPTSLNVSDQPKKPNIKQENNYFTFGTPDAS
jgi:hypothetical protein